MRYIINGQFLLEPAMGVQRYATEITKQWDVMLGEHKNSKIELEIVVPEHVKELDVLQKKYKHIPIHMYGKHCGRKWEQTDFAQYLKKRHGLQVSLCNTLPLFSKGGIVCIHDICFKTHPEFFTQPGDWHEILFRKMLYHHACSFADNIVTVSNFSKKEIKHHYHLKNKNICVAGNAWQHYDHTTVDESIFAEYPIIEKGEYYYYLASLAPNKNLKWILENAKKNPNRLYVLSGRHLGDASGVEELSNVLYTGFVSDERAKALMANCRAFLFPSFYEGFGIPPMEALCMGAKIVISNIPSLKEVYGCGAYYIDCNNADCDLDALLEKECKSSPKEILSRYSWRKSAEEIFKLFK